jgi:hypothetical protein
LVRLGGGGLGSDVLVGGALTTLKSPEPEELLEVLGPSNEGPKSKLSSASPLSRIDAPPSIPEPPEEADEEACCGVGNGITRPALAAAVCCWRAASSC